MYGYSYTTKFRINFFIQQHRKNRGVPFKLKKLLSIKASWVGQPDFLKIKNLLFLREHITVMFCGRNTIILAGTIIKL